jgi:sphingosine kinase
VIPRKRVLVLVNPVGGKGKARSIVKETVLPIFEAAGCAVTMMGESHLYLNIEIAKWPETQHAHHAEQLAKDITLDYE